MFFGGAGKRCRGRAGAAALIVLACALVAPAVASAEGFTVDSTADEVDAVPGNEVCLTAGGKCTLRAAIEESNSSLGEHDEILFDEAVFEGQVTGTISLTSSLPAVIDPAFINGKECPTPAGLRRPCVGVDGPSGAPALIVENAEGVEIEGLAVTGAQTGISVNNSKRFKAQANWFGVKLDGSAAGDVTGIFIGPKSEKSTIGGEGPEARNVFANNTGDGLDIHGAPKVKVLGNYFGVAPDGATKAANGKDIEVTSTSPAAFEAIGTTIGTKVRPEAVASRQCDFGCNVISGAETSGIDLQGDGGSEAPAVATTIAGNYIGLDATGTAPVPNVSSGIRVGKAPRTVIGGPSAGEANRINGGGVSVLAGPEAEDLAVRGNLIGVDAAGTGTLAPPANGISVNSGELSTAAVEAVIAENEIRMEGGVAIAQQGFGAWIAGNEIAGAATGIKTSGSIQAHGNLIEGNLIEGLEVNGILVENNFNEILGNEISQALGAGIRIDGSLLSFGVKGNLVGGDATREENVIAGSGGAAIEISDVKNTQNENEVARNRGIANRGPFIDLVAASPGTEPDPNNGIKPPAFSTTTPASASGSAEAGARVRVFRKQRVEAGEINSFLGEAIADGGGNWKVIYGAALPGGTIVAATQTNKAGGTSELSTATTAAEPGGSSNGTSSPAIPPQTKIVKAPKKRSHSTTARFRFKSDVSGSTFQCRLDGKRFSACKSPKKYEGLAPGRHVFEVRAIDPAGNADPSPAKKKFTVLGPR